MQRCFIAFFEYKHERRIAKKIEKHMVLSLRYLLTCFFTNLYQVFKTSSNLVWWNILAVLIVKMISLEWATCRCNLPSFCAISWYLHSKLVPRLAICTSWPWNLGSIGKAMKMKLTVTITSKENLPRWVETRQISMLFVNFLVTNNYQIRIDCLTEHWFLKSWLL